MFLKNKKEEKIDKEAARVLARPCSEKQGEPVAINYVPTVEELTDTIMMLVDKRSPKSRKIMGVILFVIAVGCVGLYAWQPYGINFAFGAIIFAIFGFLVLWYPLLKGKRDAKAISKRQGVYKLVLTPDGFIKPYGEEPIDLWADKDCRGFESDLVFAIRADHSHSFCIPKRILNAKQLEQVRYLVKTYTPTFIDKCNRESA